MFKVCWVVEVGDVDARSCRGMAALRCWKWVDEMIDDHDGIDHDYHDNHDDHDDYILPELLISV